MNAKNNSSAGKTHINRDKWQDYFYLSPNVRFTRTPDRELARQPEAIAAPRGEMPVDEKPVAAKPVDAKPEDERLKTQGNAAALPEAAALAASTPVHGTPREMLETLRSLLAVDRLVETPLFARMSPACPDASSHVPQRTTPVAQDETAITPVIADDCWSNLSDHAFFDGVILDRGERDTCAAAGAPAPVEPPMPQTALHDIAEMKAVTALYRVIECSTATGAGHEPPPPVCAPKPQEAAVPASPQQLAVPAKPKEIVALPEAQGEKSGDEGKRVFRAARMSSKALPGVGAATGPLSRDAYEFPAEDLLQLPPEGQGFYMAQERMEQNADLLEGVLEDFGIRGEIIEVHPGPVVTLYEFEPAPGVKSSRVIGLADDIARSMSAVSARVAVVPGRNVIGIELPNEKRETVYFREMIEAEGFRKTSYKLALGLGKTIGGEPVIVELAKMPHLLVAGTTGSGKSVAINTMVLSLLYRLKPEECRLIMVDPKMLELSVYDGIPHLLTPVVTDPKKAVTALKWAVREMEDRYRKMARLGVRNIDGYNQRMIAARDNGEPVVVNVQTGLDQATGEPLFEEHEMDLAPMPYIVVVVDEMADLMMVAGKEIEGAIQRLAQMARAAGIHLIMATQRPSVDVITGTIKANFPTRISFQVTSKIDSRTILGEQGAEQLLGQGDMLHMAGGGRIVRVHGPFVSDNEVEQVVAHLKTQGRPEYLETVTADEAEEEAACDQAPVFDKGAIAAEDGDDLFEQAVKVVLRDRKCSTSYIQRRLGIGYNRAATLVERMEKEGLVGAPNHVGKREILVERGG